jgi:lysyl-tRNA synthetase class 2
MNLVNVSALALLVISTQQYASAFLPVSGWRFQTCTSALFDTIVSPFDDSGGDGSSVATESAQPTKLVGPLDLTWDNVEAVLDEMRPFLVQDGGNVVIQDIDGPVVRLELQVRI